MRRGLFPVGCCFAALVALGVGQAAGLRLNLSDSMPRGVWRVVPGEVRRGDVILFCLDGAAARVARERRYLGTGSCPNGLEPLVKPVVALGGDAVRVAPEGVSVNGVTLPGTAGIERDGAGQALAQEAAPDGELWVVASRDPRSWDSRYWGPLPRHAVIGRVVPMWVTP